EEHDEEQQHRFPGHSPGHGRPADEHRHAAGGSAPHDVLRGAALEDESVEDGVEQDRGRGEAGGDPVRESAEPEDRAEPERGCEDQCGTRADLTGDQRTILRPLHLRVDIAIDVAVEDRGRSRSGGTADERVDHEPDVRQTVSRQEHHGSGRDQEQLDDARLRQRNIGADDRSRSGAETLLVDGPLQRSFTLLFPILTKFPHALDSTLCRIFCQSWSTVLRRTRRIRRRTLFSVHRPADSETMWTRKATAAQTGASRTTCTMRAETRLREALEKSVPSTVTSTPTPIRPVRTA